MNWSTKRISPCECERRRFRRTGEVRYAFFRFLQFVIVWSRVRSSSFWSLSLKLISNRGPMDTGRRRQVRRRSTGKQGVPQGGVISPLLSNIYLTEVDKMLEKAIATARRGRYNHVQYARF